MILNFVVSLLCKDATVSHELYDYYYYYVHLTAFFQDNLDKLAPER